MITLVRRGLAVCLVAVLLSSGCSSCDGEVGSQADAGPADTGADGDTDADTDTGTYATDAGPWDWQELPAGEDCGPGCREITNSYAVSNRQWDVTNGYLAYSGLGDGVRVRVSNYDDLTYLVLPEVHQDTPITSIDNGAQWAAIDGARITYFLILTSTSPMRSEIVRADLGAQIQQVLWQRDEHLDELGAVITELDAYGDRVVTRAGCGDLDDYGLCAYEAPWPAAGQELIPDWYGLANTIWDERVVFLDTRAANEPWDVGGYDFSTGLFFSVTDDDEYQSWPRFQGNHVVYMDFRLGDGEPTGSWENVAVFVKDLSAEETVQLTDGAAIASHPDVHGDIVVWMDSRHCDNPQDKEDMANIEIYGYNLATETEARITNLPGRPKQHPRVWGDKVFVHMPRTESEGDAIYMFALPTELTVTK